MIIYKGMNDEILGYRVIYKGKVIEKLLSEKQQHSQTSAKGH